MKQLDRRKQRTREALHEAMVALMRERGYAAITIRDVAERANVGRSTLYLHYGSKEELFLGCHEAMARLHGFGRSHPLSREEFLSDDTPSGLIQACLHLKEERMLLRPVLRGQDAAGLLQAIRERRAQAIEQDLKTVFDGRGSMVSLDALANYLAGAQVGLLHWWLEQRCPCTAEELARVLHSLQRSTLLGVFG